MSEIHLNNAVIGDKNNKDNIYNDGQKRPLSSKSNKSKRPMNIIKVALHMLRNKKGGLKSSNKSALPASTNTALTQIMGSVRPLYLQSSVGEASPPPSLPSNEPLLAQASPDQEAKATDQEGGVVVTMSPGRQDTLSLYTASTSRCSSSRSSSLGGGMSSKFASAHSLYDLDYHDDDTIEEEENNNEGDGDAYYESLQGDALIDVKAELFIANFYQQMRLQD